MRISGAAYAGNTAPAGSSKEAQIKRQIKTLEKKKQKLLKKLSKMVGGGSSDSASIAKGTATVAGSSSASTAATSTAVAGTTAGTAETTGSNASVQGAVASSPATQTAPAPIRIQASTLSLGNVASDDDDDDDDASLPDNPKDIQKMIMAIEMQLATLRSQLESGDGAEADREAMKKALSGDKKGYPAAETAGHAYQSDFGDAVQISDAALSMSAPTGEVSTES